MGTVYNEGRAMARTPAPVQTCICFQNQIAEMTLK